MDSSLMTTQEAIATLERLYTNVSIYCHNAGIPSDIRDPWWGISPDLLEQCEQAIETLEQVVSADSK